MTRSILFWRSSFCSTHSMFLSNQDRKIIYLLPVFTESFLLCKSDYFQLHHCTISFSGTFQFHQPWLVLAQKSKRKPFFCRHCDRCLFIVLGMPAASERLPSCGTVRTLSSQATLLAGSHPAPAIITLLDLTLDQCSCSTFLVTAGLQYCTVTTEVTSSMSGL